jgi:hypothetical protein
MSMLPLQGSDDFADDKNDTILIPQAHFDVLFGDALGGILGVKITVENDGPIYATCTPHTENDEDVIYLPNWMLEKLGSDSLADVVRADPLPEATGIVARLIDDAEVDVRGLLEEQLYDFRYVHADTVLTIGSGTRVWIETVYAGEETVAVARLGTELTLLVEKALTSHEIAEPEAQAQEPIQETILIPDAAEIRRLRAAYYEAAFQRK